MKKDPYRYFRVEAQDLLEGLRRGALDLEKGQDQELMRRLLRQAHTLKGASRVVKRFDIGDLAHDIENVLAPYRDSGGPEDRAPLDRMGEILNDICAIVASLDQPANDNQPIDGRSTDGAPTMAETGDAYESIRVDVAELDTLMASVAEARSAAAALEVQTNELEELRVQTRGLLNGLRSTPAYPIVEHVVQRVADIHRTLCERTGKVQRELLDLEEFAAEIRLVPAATLVTDLESTVRDAARSLNKDATLHVTGADIHLDAHVVMGLRIALLHVIRNSVAHGIETPERREAVGKGRAGRIELTFRRKGHYVIICCSDDGSGLDFDRVRAAAVKCGALSAPEADSADDGTLLKMLWGGGITTSATVNDVSGRGVGLEAARHAVESLRGKVNLDSTRGRGTTFEMTIPMSLFSMQVLSVRTDEENVLVPLDAVRCAIRFTREELAQDVDGERLVVEGKVLPFLPIQRALNQGTDTSGEMQSGVVLEVGGEQAVIGVDGVGTSSTAVVHHLPAHAAADQVVAGAAFDRHGTPVLVCAPHALIQAARRQQDGRSDVQGVPSLPPLLVIDDSLTTRMLEQSILESAGYEVDVAVSAEDGLMKAHQRQYGVYIVDVEMPGMNGFEFIARTKKEPDLRDTPAILVTSLDDPEHKRRGKEVGARGYIFKSEFDQKELLEAIRRLIA